MDYTALKAEIVTDPKAKGYAAHLPNDPVRVEELINARTETMAKSRYVTARTIMAECDDSEAILVGLKGAAATSMRAECAWNFLNRDSGLDIGNSRTLAMCDEFAVGGVWTVAQAAQVKAMANQPASRAEMLGLGNVTARDIVDAWGT